MFPPIPPLNRFFNPRTFSDTSSITLPSALNGEVIAEMIAPTPLNARNPNANVPTSLPNS